MNEVKSWGTTRTGMVFHSFKADGTAACRSNIRGEADRTEYQVDKVLAEAWGLSALGYRKCETCAVKESAARGRLEASLAPSTGEGDYLPPAEAPEPIAETPENREDDMNERRKTEGPLTPTQRRIADNLAAGLRQNEIALELGKSVQYVSGEVAIIVGKMGARTTVEAIRIYGQALAYRRASLELLNARVASPVDDAEKHVNHVLTAIAQLYQGWHDARMPE